jgi:hypothetical protein
MAASEIYQKMLKIQTELKAPKGQYNSFGKYSYRSCEDIQEGVKPLLSETKTILTVCDEIVQLGERYYIKATATLHDCESDGKISNTAYAREELEKKGMDSSQITGSTSSYARKYALNGLFCIDDVKDADTQNNKDAETNTLNQLVTDTEAKTLKSLCDKKGLDITIVFNVPVEQLTKQQYVEALKKIEKMKDKVS